MCCGVNRYDVLLHTDKMRQHRWLNEIDDSGRLYRKAQHQVPVFVCTDPQIDHSFFQITES
jgi:hypothetical protein